MPAQRELGQLPAPPLCQARSSACIGQLAWAGQGALLPQGAGRRVGTDQGCPGVGRKRPRWEAQEQRGVSATTLVLLSKEKRFLTTLGRRRRGPAALCTLPAANPGQPHRRNLWMVHRGLGEARLLPKADRPSPEPGGAVRGPCWPAPGPVPWPHAGSTRPGCSRGCASAAAWGRCAVAASRCPGTRRCSGSHRDLGKDAGKGGAGAGRCWGSGPVPKPLPGSRAGIRPPASPWVMNCFSNFCRNSR